MRRLTIGVSAAAVLWVAGVSGQVPPPTDNVAAFARLYGVVRYFYPSDAAASLDWNRFAVHGVRQVRAAKDALRLETTLRELVRPLGPGIEIGSALPPAPAHGNADGSLIAWRYRGAAVSPPVGRGPYAAKRTNRALVTGPNIDGFVTDGASATQRVEGNDAARVRDDAVEAGPRAQRAVELREGFGRQSRRPRRKRNTEDQRHVRREPASG